MIFCNDYTKIPSNINMEGHNPYFNRWFSAIFEQTTQNKEDKSHNPYFNRWFSAMTYY